MARARIAVTAVVAVGFVFILATLVALEGREVVALRTFDEHGNLRRTRTWVADEDGSAWIEAANPDRPFLRQLQAHPEVELQRGGKIHQCYARTVPNPDGHQRVRRLLAAKYGWADRWIGLLTDTSASVAVRLRCDRVIR